MATGISGRAAIVVSSHVVRGSVGNRAMVHALEAMGRQVWAVPTLVLPWHPGHGPGTRIVPDGAAFDALIADLGRAPFLPEVGAVISGYLAGPGQAEAVAGLVAAARAANRDAFYLCDPVIGDRGGLYVPEATARAVRDTLLPLADIATPNRTELEWLAGRPLAGLSDIVAAARALGPAQVIVTSAPGHAADRIANLLVRRDGATDMIEHEIVERPPNGPGDLTAALYAGHLLAGTGAAEALARTSASVLEMLATSRALGKNELALETDISWLEAPNARVTRIALDAEGERST